MIRVGTVFEVIDNSGVKTARTIGIGKKRYATLSDIVVASVQKVNKFSAVMPKTIGKFLIVGTVSKKYGIKFSKNMAVMIKNKDELVAQRIKYPVPFELLELCPNIKRLFSAVPALV